MTRKKLEKFSFFLLAYQSGKSSVLSGQIDKILGSCSDEFISFQLLP